MVVLQVWSLKYKENERLRVLFGAKKVAVLRCGSPILPLQMNAQPMRPWQR